MRLITFAGLITATLAVFSPALLPAQEPTRAAPGSAEVVQLVRQGEADVQKGDLPAAEAAFTRAVQRAPDFSDAHLGLGLVALRLGKPDAAVSSLRRATELNPSLPGAHMFLGIAEYQRGQGEAAASALKAELGIQRSNVEALTWLGIVDLAIGRAEEAASSLDEASALAPNDPNILYYKGQAHGQAAEAAYQQLYKLDPDSVLVHRALGDTLAKSGQPEKAIAEYEAAIRKQPDNPDLYELLGEQNQKMSRVDAAVVAYQQELKLNPHSAIALYNLGVIDIKRGEPAKGVPLLREAEGAHAASAPTDFYLGLGLAELGKTDEAAHWLELSLAHSPSPFIEQSAYYQLVRAYQKLHRPADEQRALAQLRKLKAEAATTITGAGSVAGDEGSGVAAGATPASSGIAAHP